MILSTRLRFNIAYTIALLYILLFLYAAVSKLLDFENFSVQIGQSPLLSEFASTVAVAVPAIEIALALMLFTNRFRFIALLGCATLMMMFSAYIYIIVNYSAFVPCSCGGVLEKMDWNQHLIFNIVFVLLAAVAALLIPLDGNRRSQALTIRVRILILICALFFGAAIVIVLYRLSENAMRHSNSFIRRFPTHAAQEIHQADLKFNSFYFAGAEGDKIYLGNLTAPLTMTVIDTALATTSSYTITLDKTDLPFRRPQLKVNGTDLYVYEGTGPYIFKGSTSDWKGYLLLHSGNYFSQLQPGNDGTLFLRYIAASGESFLGALHTADTASISTSKNLLEKQLDGIFDTDGQLHFSHSLDKMVYLYRYRNQYTVADENMKLQFRGNTIDTVTKAQLEIARVESHKTNTLKKPPLIVNRQSAVDGRHLYVNAALMGRLEPEEMWKVASIIDVYDLTDQTYQASFYLYHIEGKRIRSFIVRGNRAYALINDKIAAYKLSDHLVGRKE